MSDSQVFIELFICLITGVLAVRLGTTRATRCSLLLLATLPLMLFYSIKLSFYRVRFSF